MHDTTGTPERLLESIAASRQDNTRVTPSQFPGRLVDKSRTSICKTYVWTDDAAAVNEELEVTIPSKILKMQTTFTQGIDINFEGQVGFICLEKNEQNEPISCVAVTALHNITQAKDLPTATYTRSTAFFPEFDLGLDFSEAGSKLAALTPYDLSSSQEQTPFRWKPGVDIAWGSEVFTADMSSKIVESSFERVRDDFEYKVGQRIGIGVYSEVRASKKTICISTCNEEELSRVYGPPKTNHIYTGTITAVGPKHIEYDINAFDGCAGAIVFLLGSESQPNDSGVTHADVGKAIAVHTGAHPGKLKNFGFKTSAKPPSNGL